MPDVTGGATTVTVTVTKVMTHTDTGGVYLPWPGEVPGTTA